MNNLISTQFDDFLIEQQVHKTMWYALLSDGIVVIQDDGHPDKLGSSWLRLKDYIGLTGLFISKVWFAFRNNEVKNFLPDNAEGYFFINNVVATDGSPSFSFYIFGWLDGDVVRTKRFKIPECVLFDEGHRSRDDAQKGLILNVQKIC